MPRPSVCRPGAILVDCRGLSLSGRPRSRIGEGQVVRIVYGLPHTKALAARLDAGPDRHRCHPIPHGEGPTGGEPQPLKLGAGREEASPLRFPAPAYRLAGAVALRPG